MKLAQLLEGFDDPVNASEGLGKTRELILHFAVTGRLSEQWNADAPVGELIKMMSDARARAGHGQDRDLSNSNHTGPVTYPVAVPKHWAWVTLKEIGRISGGMTPSKAKPTFWNGRHNWFSSKDIKSDELITSELKISGEAITSTGLQMYLPGSLVFVARSGILKRTFPVSILRVSGTVNQDLKVLAPFLPGLERYIQIMLRGMTRFILSSLVKTGMTVQSLKFEEFESQLFPFPPLAEQKRIVAKVDELMALCDRLEVQQNEREARHAALARASLARFADAPTPANLTFLFHQSYTIPPGDLRKTILTLAVQGKLIAQQANDEPAVVLLSRIDNARAELQRLGTVAKQRAIRDEVDGHYQHPIPDTWQRIRLQRVAEIIDPNPSHRMPRYCASGIPFVSTENFTAKDQIDLTIGKQVDVAELDAQKRRFSIRSGSFALSRIGTIGKTRMLPLERTFCMSHALVVIAPYCQDIDPRFLRVVVSSDAVQGQATDGAQSIGVPDLGMAKIRSFVVPLPPLAEQRRIVAKVDQLMALVDELETQLAASRGTATKLLDAIVTELTA